MPAAIPPFDPDSAGRAALDAAEQGADADELDRLMDLIRAPALQGVLVQRLLSGLGWKTSEYRAFDKLPELTRLTMLGKDAWVWHRLWLDSALPASCKAKLAGDLVLVASDPGEIQEIEARKLLPKSITQIALGRVLVRQDRVAEGAAHFRRAVSEDASSGPVFRYAGEGAFLAGRGLTANEWFHISLHAEDPESFDLKVRETGSGSAPQEHRCIFDYYGNDYLKSGRAFVTRTFAGRDPVDVTIMVIKLKIARYIPPRTRAWLRANLPRGVVARPRRVLYLTLKNVRRIFKTLGKSRQQPHLSENLLDLCRRAKTAAQTGR